MENQKTFDKTEVESFLTELIQNVWTNGEIDRLSEFYAEDLIGHYNDSTYNFSDIKDRMQTFNEICKQRRFEMINLIVINELSIVKIRQVWLRPEDGRLCESSVCLAYKIIDRKIVEVWVIADGEKESYQDINNHLSTYFTRFELETEGKKDFYKHLKDQEFLHQNKKAVKLTKKELEVLFYYINGYTVKEIALEMNVSNRTAENHVANIKEKYQCSNKVELRKILFPRMAKKENA